MLKSTDTRAESQPAKKTHVLTKQDSSKYLRGSSVVSDGQVAFNTGIGSTKASVKRTMRTQNDQTKPSLNKFKVTPVNSNAQRDQNGARDSSNTRGVVAKQTKLDNKDISRVVNSQTVSNMNGIVNARGQS